MEKEEFIKMRKKLIQEIDGIHDKTEDKDMLINKLIALEERYIQENSKYQIGDFMEKPNGKIIKIKEIRVYNDFLKGISFNYYGDEYIKA